MPLGRKRRVALVGTGHRDAGTWGKELLANCGEWVELVGLCKAERIRVRHQPGGHFGGDPALHRMLFAPDMADPLSQRAGAEAGALSVLTGVAAFESARRGVPIDVKSLL